MEVDLSRPPVVPDGLVVLKGPEVAELLHVTADVVSRWAAAGYIPGAFRTLGRGQWRFPRAAVDELLAHGWEPRRTG